MGVNHLQGFLISRPLSAADIVAYLDRGAPVLTAAEPDSIEHDLAQLLGGPEPLSPTPPAEPVDFLRIEPSLPDRRTGLTRRRRSPQQAALSRCS